MKDSNPLVAGRGIRKLRQAGVTVVLGVLEGEARKLNRIFIKHITSGMPYVHLKIAQSLDGRIAGTSGKIRWISSRASRLVVHEWRAQYDAVLVGAGTVLADDPSLTVRMVKGRDPDIVILDGRLSVPVNAAVFRSARARRVFVCVDSRAVARHDSKVRQLMSRGATILPFKGHRSALPLRQVLRKLYGYNIGSILVEGGSRIFTQFLDEGFVDEMSIFVAPVVVGQGVPAFTPMPGRNSSRHRFQPGSFTAIAVGRDILLKAFVESEE